MNNDGENLRKGAWLFASVVALLAFVITRPAFGLETLYKFQPGPRNPQAGLVFGGDGRLYGTAYSGGNGGFGAGFSTTTNGVMSNLVSFGYTNGANPAAALALAPSGLLYGTAYQGGDYDLGTLFEMTTNGSMTKLVSFDGATNGAYPLGGLAGDTEGNFYGTTYTGGASAAGRFIGFGTAFKITAGGRFAKLVDFNYYNGSNPQGPLLWGGDGYLYGTTAYGGLSSNGTAFKMTAGGALTTLASFEFANGAVPCGGLVRNGADGNFYGTTASGGSSSNGTIFTMTPRGQITTLVSFNGLNGSNPQAGLVGDTKGNFYGTTYGGGAFGSGTVFKITPAGTFATLVSFNYVNGANPQGALVMDGGGNFYGTTAFGGASGAGTVFRLTPFGELTTLASINPGAGFPTGGVIVSGNVVYGTTAYGGPTNNGAVFGVTNTGSLLTMLVPFSGINPATPNGISLQGADGNFYGTTFGGGTGSNSSSGTIFRITPAGILTNLVSFGITNGLRPLGGVAQGMVTNLVTVTNTNSITVTTAVVVTNLYGTTSQGGPTDSGVVYRLALGQTNLLTPQAFFGYYDYAGGAFPEGPVIQGTDGNFYGTTAEGGPGGYGTVFKMTPTGMLTTLASFAYTNGSNPETGLTQNTDGDFYGTTSSGGDYGYGTVFQVTTNGTLNAIASFDGINSGALPQGPLVLGNDGSFYGTTQLWGPGGYGTVFSITSTGGPINRVVFDGANGAYPNGGLGRGADGHIYGTTAQGGDFGAGTVFRLGVTLKYSISGNQLILSWPTNAPGFTLQSSVGLGTNAAWVPVTNGVVTDGINFVRPTDFDTRTRPGVFFRLIQP